MMSWIGRSMLYFPAGPAGSTPLAQRTPLAAIITSAVPGGSFVLAVFNADGSLMAPQPAVPYWRGWRGQVPPTTAYCTDDDNRR